MVIAKITAWTRIWKCLTNHSTRWRRQPGLAAHPPAEASSLARGLPAQRDAVSACDPLGAHGIRTRDVGGVCRGGSARGVSDKGSSAETPPGRRRVAAGARDPVPLSAFPSSHGRVGSSVGVRRAEDLPISTTTSFSSAGFLGSARRGNCSGLNQSGRSSARLSSIRTWSSSVGSVPWICRSDRLGRRVRHPAGQRQFARNYRRGVCNRRVDRVLQQNLGP